MEPQDKIKRDLFKALDMKYLAEAQEAYATLETYFNNPAGIGESPQIVEEMDKQVTKLTDSEDKCTALRAHFKDYYEE